MFCVCGIVNPRVLRFYYKASHDDVGRWTHAWKADTASINSSRRIAASMREELHCSCLAAFIMFLDLQSAQNDGPVSQNKRTSARLGPFFWGYTAYTLCLGILTFFGQFRGPASFYVSSWKGRLRIGHLKGSSSKPVP